MTVYLYCYVAGEGYTLKRASFAGTVSLTRIKRNDLPEEERRLFLDNGINLFWDGKAFGCVRNLESDFIDENGRKCYVNAAFSDADGFSSDVEAVMTFALNHRQCFLDALEEAICYENGDYFLNDEQFRAFLKCANESAKNSARIPSVMVIEDGITDYQVDSESHMVRQSTDDWKQKELRSARVFFYATTPSSGFVLQRIDPATGKKISTSYKAYADLFPSERKILNNAGASLAIFEESGYLCLVVKGLRSPKTDRYGRRQQASFVIDVPVAESQTVLQMGAWALLNNDEFAAEVTECLRITDAGTSYEVMSEKSAHLISRFTLPLKLPSGAEYDDVWNKIVDPSKRLPYRLLVLEASLDYFRRSNEINVKDEDIGLLITSAQMSKYRESPMKITFSASMYRLASSDIRDDTTSLKMSDTQIDAKEKLSDDKSMIEETAEQDPSENQIISELESNINIESTSDSVNEQSTGDFNDKDNSDSKAKAEDEERINLLDYKWFIPSVIGAVLAIIIIIILIIRFS